jgi:hypothetical protein
MECEKEPGLIGVLKVLSSRHMKMHGDSGVSSRIDMTEVVNSETILNVPDHNVDRKQT